MGCVELRQEHFVEKTVLLGYLLHRPNRRHRHQVLLVLSQNRPLGIVEAWSPISESSVPEQDVQSAKPAYRLKSDQHGLVHPVFLKVYANIRNHIIDDLSIDMWLTCQYPVYFMTQARQQV
jgi:hypothetical protein